MGLLRGVPNRGGGCICADFLLSRKNPDRGATYWGGRGLAGRLAPQGLALLASGGLGQGSQEGRLLLRLSRPHSL